MKTETIRKGIFGVVLCFLMLIPVFSFAVSAKTMAFTDVKKTDWFYNDVKTAFETDLINGKDDKTFDPTGKLTYSEVVTLAARMNERYSTGKVTLTNGDPWYQPFVDYCKKKGSS